MNMLNARIFTCSVLHSQLTVEVCSNYCERDPQNSYSIQYRKYGQVKKIRLLKLPSSVIKKRAIKFDTSLKYA